MIYSLIKNLFQQASEKGRMSVNELILNKEEMERLLVDALPQSGDNKSEAVK